MKASSAAPEAKRRRVALTNRYAYSGCSDATVFMWRKRVSNSCDATQQHMRSFDLDRQ